MRTWARTFRFLSLFLLLLLGVFFLSTCSRSYPKETASAAPLRYPSFPWPPPQASATEVVPAELLKAEGGPTWLRDIDRRITHALEQNGYYESSYYAVPAGFALVTKMEHIESDGTPKEGLERWMRVPQPRIRFSLTTYLAALFRGTLGYYRVIVFIVTPLTFAQSAEYLPPDVAEEWLRGGMNRLPQSIGDLEFSRDYACTALIYVFEQAETEGPRIQLSGGISGHAHLEKAGIWEVLQQWPQ